MYQSYDQEREEAFWQESMSEGQYLNEAHHRNLMQAGGDEPEKEYILSAFDVWEKNPYYTGEPGPHPDDPREFDQ